MNKITSHVGLKNYTTKNRYHILIAHRHHDPFLNVKNTQTFLELATRQKIELKNSWTKQNYKDEVNRLTNAL